jgi:hypothetical protein
MRDRGAVIRCPMARAGGLALFAICVVACTTTTDVGDAGTACARASDCRAGTTCIAGACVASMPCASSRMCPNLVCSATSRVCVECNTDGDCDAGLVCTAGVCSSPPPACASDRDCSSMALVCDRTHMVCVECVTDTDCAATQVCAVDHACQTRLAIDAGPDASEDAGHDVGVDAFAAMSFDAGVDAFGLPSSDAGVDVFGLPSSDAGGDASCAAPRTSCPVGCVDTTTDPANCGSCGYMCTPTMTCIGGACGCAVAGTIECGPMHRCMDPMTDPANCGACDNSCGPGGTCNGGTCTCGAGYTLCGTSCVNTAYDRDHCGSCGNACAATIACVAGACAQLYHGWSCPIAGCLTDRYDTTAPTALGGTYPYVAGDAFNCRAWKLAATVCTTEPVDNSDSAPLTYEDWWCASSGGFTDPEFGTYCLDPSPQYACSNCVNACNARCGSRNLGPLTLRDCSGQEVAQP